jgi:hypothetical protein
MEEDEIPLPRPDMTPPETKTYFISTGEDIAKRYSLLEEKRRGMEKIGLRWGGGG